VLGRAGGDRYRPPAARRDEPQGDVELIENGFSVVVNARALLLPLSN
jgi:hypothetical protein